MPRLPDVESLGRRPVPQSRRGIAQQDTTAPGEAMAGLGQTVARVGANLFGQEMDQQRQAEREKQRAASALALAKTTNDLHDAHDEVQRGVMSGEVQTDQADSVLQKRMDEVRTKGLASLSTEQRSAIAPSMESTTGSLKRNLAGTVFKRNQSDVAGAIDQYSEQAARDVPRIGAVAAASKFDAFVDFNGDAAGLSPASQAKVKQANRENVHFVSLQAQGADAYKAGSISGIEDVRKAIKANDVLDPAKKTQLDNQLFAYKNTLEAEAQRALNRADAESEKRLKAAEKASEELRKFATTGAMPDAGYQIAVLEATRGTPFEAGAKVMLTAATKGAGFGSQPLTKQRAELRAAESGAASGGTSPDQQAALQYARTVNETQEREYKENPWAASTRFARAAPVPEVAIGSAAIATQVAAERMPLIDEVERNAGAPVSPLQPGEAKQYVEKLRTLPPDARADALGQMGDGLTVPRIAALADQLDKGDKPIALALKLGADKTTAGRNTSALVLRGAQALTDKAVKRDDAALTGWRSEISGLVRGTLGDDRAEQDVIDASYYVRAAMDSESTPVAGFGLDASARNAVNMVIGQPMDRGGVKTLLPRGMKEDAFDKALVDRYTPDTLRTMLPKTFQGAAGSQVLYVRGAPLTLEKFSGRITDYGMQRAGPAGEFMPISGGAVITTDKEGRDPLILRVTP